MTRPVLPDPRSDLARPVPRPAAEQLTGHITGHLSGADVPHLLSEAVRGLFGSLPWSAPSPGC